MRPHLLLALVLCSNACAQTPSKIIWTPVFSGVPKVIAVRHAGDGSGRLYLAQQTGEIRMAQGGKLNKTLFLDLRKLTRARGEQGLLGLAFDPKYKKNRRVYVHYTNLNGDTVLARYTARPDFAQADPKSAKILFTTSQPYSNHNGGQIAFGPDGFLYLGLGDGGSGGDPQNNSQNLATPLGKMLRFDVRGAEAKVPASNPFVKRKNANPYIWAYGLRNPWQFSFDRKTGNLMIGDVGQNAYEEVHVQPANSKGGENYGWRKREGRVCYEKNCSKSGMTEPVLVYGRQEGQSITGGYVYRGKKLAQLTGQYIFGDFASGRIWAAQMTGSDWKKRLISKVDMPSTFGEDEAGELYVVEYAKGRVLRIGK